MCHFFTPVCSHRLSRAIHRTFFSRLAGAQFADRITCLAIAVLFQFEHTLSQLTCFTHTHTHAHTFFSLNMSENILFLFMLHVAHLLARLSRAILHNFSRLAGAPSHPNSGIKTSGPTLRKAASP